MIHRHFLPAALPQRRPSRSSTCERLWTHELTRTALTLDETELTLRVAAGYPRVPFVVVAQTVHASAVAMALQLAEEPRPDAVAALAERRLDRWLENVTSMTATTTRDP